jgi:hypothetical protein
MVNVGTIETNYLIYLALLASHSQYELPWSESLSLNIEEILIRPPVCACVHLSSWDHNVGVLKASIVLKFLLDIYIVFLFAKPIF